jgi:hypothetical protein
MHAQDDITRLIPLVTKGKVLWCRGSSNINEEMMRIQGAIYIYDGKLFSPGGCIEDFSRIINIETPIGADRDYIARILIPGFHDLYLSGRGIIVSDNYISILSGSPNEGPATASKVRAICKNPIVMEADGKYIAEFYIVHDSTGFASFYKWVIEIDREMFFISNITCRKLPESGIIRVDPFIK